MDYVCISEEKIIVGTQVITEDMCHKPKDQMHKEFDNQQRMQLC